MMPTPNYPMASFLPLFLFAIPTIIFSFILAKEKGKNILLWTLLAFIPVFNFLFLLYLVGATNKILEEKVDSLIKILNEKDIK
ncbi:hypothetical protein ACFLSE_04120 [Bacteroidota bacterium]